MKLRGSAADRRRKAEVKMSRAAMCYNVTRKNRRETKRRDVETSKRLGKRGRGGRRRAARGRTRQEGAGAEAE